MSHLFVNCEYGISGDLTLAALVDLGADPQYIESELKKLPIDDFSMSFSKKDEKGITANKLNLNFAELDEDHDHHGHHHHSAQGIFQLIEESDLADRVKERSLAIFKEVARAEGKIHGKPADQIHFHEVGAMDSIIDIIGVCLALEDLDVDYLTFSKVPTGHGKIEIAHGLYPVPAPATMEILVGVPLSAFTAEGELTTPTGAAFAKVLADDYADVVEGTVEKIGYGVGDREFDHPNVLRIALLKKLAGARESVSVIECQVDDMTGEALGYLLRLLESQQEVLDVFYSPVKMKKDRPGVLITILTPSKDKESVAKILLKESSSFGVRYYDSERLILAREFTQVALLGGWLQLKIGYLDGKIIKVTPEYDDLVNLARDNHLALSQVYQKALVVIEEKFGSQIE